MVKRPRAQDIAEAVGVSQTTVSFVLNEQSGHVSQETRNLVLDAARSLGYYAHGPAQMLASGRSKTLGLVIRQSSEHVAGDAFLGATLQGLQAIAKKREYQVVVQSIGPGETTYDALLRAGRVDALVVSGPRIDDTEIGELIREGYPIVLQGSLPGLDAPIVDVDNEGAARTAVEHLVAAGHRRIACIVFDLEYTAARERLAGYEAGLRACGLSVEPSLIAQAGWDAADAREAMARLLTTETFSAVFVGYDVGAAGALAALRGHGRRVPEDISIVGFDDIPLAAFLDPPLTTIRVPAYEIGARAAAVLLDRLDGKTVSDRTILPTELIRRASVAPPRSRRSD